MQVINYGRIAICNFISLLAKNTYGELQQQLKSHYYYMLHVVLLEITLGYSRFLCSYTKLSSLL